MRPTADLHSPTYARQVTTAQLEAFATLMRRLWRGAAIRD